jgi:hypothetical protein
MLNEQNAGVGNGHAKDRNAWMLIFLIIGTMHELGQAVDAVQAVLGRTNRRNLPSWDRMMEIWRSWVSEKIGKDVRDQLAHHLGDSEAYEKGLDEIRLRPSFPLCFADGPTRGAGHFQGAWNLLMLGLGIDQADYLHILDQTIADVAEVDQVMLSVFVEVLKNAGIPMEDLRSK